MVRCSGEAPSLEPRAAKWTAALALTRVALVATADAPAFAADKLTVLLDWFVNPDHAPLVIAKEGGFFERAGLDVELIAPADPSAPPRLVAAGQADVAVTYQPDLMLQVKEGLPLFRFGTLIETPLNCLIVLKDGPVKSLADLKGKKIGFSIASLQDAYLTQILASAGLTAKDVTLVNVNFNLVTALLSGQVDAAIDGYRNFELIQLGLEGKPGVAYYPEEHGVPPYDELIYVASNKLRDDPRLAKFLSRRRGGDDLPHQPSRGGAGDVHEGASRPRRRAQPPRLRRDAAALRQAAGGARPWPLRSLRRVPEGARPARHPAAARHLRGRARVSARDAYLVCARTIS